MELIVGIAYQTALKEKSQNANIQLFDDFRKIWLDIDRISYESCTTDEDVHKHILPIKADLITFINDQLINFPQVRDDYKELLILALLVIGEKAPDYKIGTSRTYIIHSCGALHRARWMSKLIYSFKIYLYRSQFVLVDKELSGLKRFIVFVLVVYIKNWYQAPCALTAAKNDLQLFQQIAQFEAIDSDISKSAMKTFSRHTWYLGEELIGIAFFDSSLDVSEKQLMVEALKKRGRASPAVRPKIIVKNVMSYRISDFVTSNTLSIFRTLNISPEFLSTDPSTWSSREDYIAARGIIKSLSVVNDAAERALGHATVFNDQHMADEDQWQCLLRGVEHQRKIFPDSNKKTILRSLEGL